ncbi:MAG: rhodanese-like domain-containing protein, partial [Pseudomonadota bacterium]
GHLPGAVNIPLEELEERLPELAKEREVIAYCRGPYCLMAYEAVERLRAAGLSARRLREGYPQWREGGWPDDEAGTAADNPAD